MKKLFLMLVVLTSGTEVAFDSAIPLYAMTAVFVLLVATGEISIKKSANTMMLMLCCIVFWIVQSFILSESPGTLMSIVKCSATLFMVFVFTASSPELNGTYFEYILRVIFVLSVVSNIIFLGVLIGIPFPTIQTQTHDLTSVFYLNQYAHNTVYGLFGFRNSGVFWEPGMYQVFLNLLLFYFLYKKDISFAKKTLLVLYLIAVILSTGSVSGYVLCVAIMVLYAIRNNGKFVLKALIMLLTVAGLYIAYPYIEQMIHNKINMGLSFKYRMSDIVDGMRVFLSKPIFGHGIANKAYAENAMTTYGIQRSGNSNGMMNIFINFGLVGAGIYAVLFTRFFKSLQERYGNKIVLAAVAWLLVSMNTEPITTHPLIYFILGSSLAFVRQRDVHPITTPLDVCQSELQNVDENKGTGS